MAFPATRLRRLRRTEPLRSMVRETRLTPEAFVYPLFVCPGENVRKAVQSMPGVFNLSVDQAVKEAREASSLGVPAVILFGLPEKKDEVATGAWAGDLLSDIGLDLHLTPTLEQVSYFKLETPSPLPTVTAAVCR